MPSCLIALPKAASTGITVNSTGSGNSNGGFNATSISLTFPITVTAGSNKRMYCYVGSGTDSWIGSFSSIGASSSIDGALTELTRIHFGNNAGYFQGGLGLYRLVNPSVGTHTITISASYTQNLKVLMGNAICFNNVGGEGALQSQFTTASASAQSITVPAGNAGDMVLVGQGQSGASVRSGAWPSAAPGLFFSVEASVPGDLDWMKLAYVSDTDGTAKTFTGSNTGVKHAVAGLRLIKA